MTMETNIANKLARPAILQMEPYSSARQEYTGQQGIILDANESPWNEPWNRYPDPSQKKLRQRLAELKKVQDDNIIVGNGSDEVIDMLMRTFCEPGKDTVLSVSPTYGMYKVSALIHGARYETVTLNQDFSLPVEMILSKASGQTKMLVLCSPNNPTGNRFADEDIERLLRDFPGLVVIDEAYVDFSVGESWVGRFNEFPNLVVLQTFSKAWAMAALRLGIAIASEDIIRLMMKVKPPYNVNAFTAAKVLEALDRDSLVKEQVQQILSGRDALMKALSQFSPKVEVLPSDASFFLIRVEKADALYEYMVQEGIIIRNRSKEVLCEGCLRISTGTPQQNQYLLESVRGFLAGEKPRPKDKQWEQVADFVLAPERKASLRRKTHETDIQIELNLDGNAQADIFTRIGFFDHMLEQIPRHSGCDLFLHTQGDLHVDEHHTIEDTALALGKAFAMALGNKAGIERYGFALPMDDCAAMVLLDFGGRPELVWKATFKREYVGDIPSEMFRHFFKSFAVGAGCNLYIKAQGDNEHHKIEAIFKALARTIRMAVKREPGAVLLPSTKGML
ncbi:MAG: histidinol-phosphate transaminase [Bacteroidales bacterium]